jgi:membrane protein YdbS with pleckstrin-like domain
LEILMDLEVLALLLLAILLASVIFYVSGAIVGQDWSASGSQILRILVVALVAVFVIPIFRDIAGELGAGDLGLLFAFVVLVIVVRFVLVEEMTVSDEWLAAIVLSLMAVVMIYIVDEVSRSLFEVGLFRVI